MAVEAEPPLIASRLRLTKPVDVMLRILSRKDEKIRPHPDLYCQTGAAGHLAELHAVRNLDIGVQTVEPHSGIRVVGESPRLLVGHTAEICSVVSVSCLINCGRPRNLSQSPISDRVLCQHDCAISRRPRPRLRATDVH